MVAGPGAAAASDDLEQQRHESEAQRVDRNLAELLQELRVAGIGVQVLFGFLLSLPFTVRFNQLSGSQQALYVATLLLAALATALLTAPVAYHRVVFRHHEKERLLRAANVFALLGLTTVGIAVSGAVLLVVSVVLHGLAVPVIASLTVASFAGLWFVLPLRARWSATGDRTDSAGLDSNPEATKYVGKKGSAPQH